MEYLMTYGWAILVVIIVGVVLWQMGIFNPSGGTAPGSRGFGSVKAKDWSCSATTGIVTVQWVNGAGERISVTAPTGGCTSPVAAAGTVFNVSANGVFTCAETAACAGSTRGERFESALTLVWQPAAGGISHTESGSVWKAAEV